jgi:hypothetical protein
LGGRLRRGYRVEHEPDALILLRPDGAVVARFSARGFSAEGVVRAAEDDARGHPQYHGPEEHARSARRWVAAKMGMTWEAFVRTERRLLVSRRDGQLAKALAARLPQESREELDEVASEDRRLAREGLVELRGEGGKARYEHVNDLRPEDRGDRVRAELRRLEWLIARQERRNALVLQGALRWAITGAAGTEAAHRRTPEGLRLETSRVAPIANFASEVFSEVHIQDLA